MIACIWYFVCDYNQVWLPTIEWSRDPKLQVGLLYEYNKPQQVLIAWYTQVIMIKGNEWGPRTTTELILGSFILLFDLIIAANIFA